MDLPWLYRVDALVLFPALAALLVVATLAGSRIGRRRHAEGATADEYGLHGLDNAMLGLMALLIGFTLAMALSRYEERRAGALEEANAIGTTWLRSRLLAEPHRTETDRLLRAYLQVRLDLIRTGNVTQAIKRSDALQVELWAEATAVAATTTQPIMASLFIQSLNQTIDLQQTRISASTNRIPTVVFAVLAAVAVIGSGFSAYSGGLAGGRSVKADLISCVLVASVIVTIFDLDNPAAGFIRVSQQPFLSLAASMGLSP